MTRMVGGLAGSDMWGTAACGAGPVPARLLLGNAGLFRPGAFVASHAWLVNEPFPHPRHPAVGAFFVLHPCRRVWLRRLAGGTLGWRALEPSGLVLIFRLHHLARARPLVCRATLRDWR